MTYNRLNMRTKGFFRISRGWLLLAVLTALAWRRSYFVGDTWTLRRDIVLPTTYHRFFTTIEISEGAVEGTFESGISAPLVYRGITYHAETYHPKEPRINRPPTGEFTSMQVGGFIPFRATLIHIPFWQPVLLFLLLAVSSRKRTPLAGTCVECGYDLRATPDRCPECGTVPAIKCD
jgi:hypothetical protein